MTVHRGGCHCGAVKFEVEAPADLEVYECSCSICASVGYLHLIVPGSPPCRRSAVEHACNPTSRCARIGIPMRPRSTQRFQRQAFRGLRHQSHQLDGSSGQSGLLGSDAEHMPGVATMAARQVIERAFANTTLNRIEIVVACDNRPSQRVAEKLGANRDAVLGKRTMVNGRPADAILYSVLRPD